MRKTVATLALAAIALTASAQDKPKPKHSHKKIWIAVAAGAAATAGTVAYIESQQGHRKEFRLQIPISKPRKF